MKRLSDHYQLDPFRLMGPLWAMLLLVAGLFSTAVAGVSLAAVTILNGVPVSEVTTPDAHKVPHVLRVLTERKPADAPLWVAMQRIITSETAQAETVTWEEDSIIPFKSAINNGAGYAAGSAGAAVTWTIDDAIFQVDDTLQLRANGTAPGAVVQITAVAGATITVVRVDGGSTSAWGTVPAVVDNEPITRIHTSKKEGFDIGAHRGTMPENFSNYVEDIEGVVSITGRRERTRNYTKNDLQRSIDQQLYDFKFGQERRLWTGRKAKKVISGVNRTFSGGILEFVTGETTAALATFDEGDLIDFVHDLSVGNNGAGVRYLHVDSGLAAALAKIPLDKVRRTQAESKTLKMGLSRIEVDGFASLVIVPERAFDEMGYTNFGVALDYENLGYHPMRPMTVNKIDNLKVKGTDVKTMQLLCADTISVRNLPTHRRLRLT